MSDKVYYRSLPGAYAAREASLSQSTGEKKEVFINGFLQGVQWAKPDPDVQQCPSCGSLLMHMSGADNLRMGTELMDSGLQYDRALKCEFACRSCGGVFNAKLKLSAPSWQA
jgi:hypothetical protein